MENEKIILYSSKTCPMCKGLKMKLNKKGIEYETCEDTDFILSKGIKHIPALEIDGKILDSASSIKWVNER